MEYFTFSRRFSLFGTDTEHLGHLEVRSIPARTVESHIMCGNQNYLNLKHAGNFWVIFGTV